MECKCGAQGTSHYTTFDSFQDAEEAGHVVEKVPCTVIEKYCPACKRHYKTIWYAKDSRPKRVNLLAMMGQKK